MSELFEFFFGNQRLRWKVYAGSAGITLTYTLFNLWVLRRSDEKVFSEVIWVLVLSVLLLATIGIFASRRVHAPGDQRLVGVRPAFIIAGVLAVVFLTNMIRINVPAFQAYVADAALNYFAVKFSSVHAASLSPEQVQSNARRIQSIAANTVSSKIPINPAALTNAKNALSGYLKVDKQLPQATRQAAYSTTIDLQTAAYKRRVQAEEITPREIAKEGYVINSLLEIPKSTYFTGNHSLFALGDDIFVHDGVSAVFQGIDFLLRGGQLVVGRGGNILVIDSIVEGGDQNIDDITWVNVEFRDTRLGYRGGALRLRNVTIKGGDLSFLSFSLPHDLAEILTKNPEQPVSYVYEPTVASH